MQQNTTVSFPYFITACFAKCSFIYTTSFGTIWANGTNWDHIFIYRNRDDTVSYKSNHNVLPSYESGCKWFRGLQWPSRWYRESRKLPQCSCKSRRRLWWFRDAVIVTTIISQIATWSQMDKNCYCSPHNCQWNIYRCTNPYGFKKQCV